MTSGWMSDDGCFKALTMQPCLLSSALAKAGHSLVRSGPGSLVCVFCYVEKKHGEKEEEPNIQRSGGKKAKPLLEKEGNAGLNHILSLLASA